jgi:SAM-dependent methyltransferase
VLTVDFGQLGLKAGDRVLDVGCGGGRHAFECYRRGARVVALDLNAKDLAGVHGMFHLMREAGEAPAGATAVAIRGDIYRLPFPDHSFDVVIASEILEHIPRDGDAIAEVVRVLKPGGRLAVTVPRWWPERVCWALSDAYHEVEGGHVRIYRSAELVSRLKAANLMPTGTHHAHALHSPYWWLKCLFGVDNDAAIPKLYHKFLVYDLIRRPWWTRVPERLLNPVLGKSFVVYLDKPELAA